MRLSPHEYLVSLADRVHTGGNQSAAERIQSLAQKALENSSRNAAFADAVLELTNAGRKDLLQDISDYCRLRLNDACTIYWSELSTRLASQDHYALVISLLDQSESLRLTLELLDRHLQGTGNYTLEQLRALRETILNQPSTLDPRLIEVFLPLMTHSSDSVEKVWLLLMAYGCYRYMKGVAEWRDGEWYIRPGYRLIEDGDAMNQTDQTLPRAR